MGTSHKPSIGVSKNYYMVDNVYYNKPKNEKFAETDIIINNEVLGKTLITKKDCNPIFISIGNKINLNQSIEIVKNLITDESRIPMPTRLADIECRKIRRELGFQII